MVQPSPWWGCSSPVHRALAFPLEGWTGGESCSLDSWAEGGGKLENAYSECRRMEKKQRFSHLEVPQPLPPSTKENPWEAVPPLGCDPLPRLSTDTAALHCWMLLATVRETKWVHSYRSVKLGWITFKSFTHAKKSYTCLLNKDHLWIY